MAFATFGASMDEIDALVGRDAADWLAEEFAKPATAFLPPVLAVRTPGPNFPDGRILQDLFWTAMMEADDQLRMRMIFALSQILVVSQDATGNNQDQLAYYVDVLGANAFGDYRALLEDVTYAPVMSQFLTYFRNRRGDPNTGRMPDENYAREILQLFSIGLVELNPDGTPRLGGGGNAIPTYDNDDIVGLARVFTGLAYDDGSFFAGPSLDSRVSPLVMYDEQHSELEKSFLTATIPANTPGVESIDRALDEIFAHPNVAPFIARQLIQRFTASNPAPAYVARVAAAFESGEFMADNGRVFGDRTRGDLEATLAAILLDPSLFEDPGLQDAAAGKVREPILKFVHWVRAFNVGDIDPIAEFRLSNTRDADDLGQQFLRSPSVFNFYRPGYIAPQTESGAAGLTAPELQILNSTSASGYINFVGDFILDLTGGQNDPPRFTPDYAAELALVDDPAALIDRLDLLLTGGRLSTDAHAEILSIVENTPIRTNANEADDRLRRVETAIFLVVASPAYHVVQ
ncbi:MAG: DUF1800 family protein [Pseudomonadota bacterium]